MPSYNHEKYISEAIESVFDQDIKDLELIIVDDYSKDNSVEIIESHQNNDDRIRAIFHDKNMGIAKTLNDGIDAAEGKFIAFIASDDIWLESKLEKQLSVLSSDEDLVVWSEGEIINESGIPTGVTFTQKYNASRRKKSGDIFEELLYGNYVFGSSLIAKKENIEDIKFDECLKYLNDYRFVVDLAKKYKYHFIQEPLAKYRIHGRNAILSDEKAWLQDEIIIGEYFLRRYGNELSSRLEANLVFRIGTAYSRLGKTTIAKRFFWKAINSNLLCKDNLFYLRFALTHEDGLIGSFLANSYKTASSSLAQLGRKIRHKLEES